MHLSRRIKIQFALFTAIALVAGLVMIFGYMRVPAMFGVGRYRVTVDLPQAAGLYETANVTYRGTEVGRVTSVHLTDAGVTAVLTLKSDIKIPSDLDVQVHSQSAVGEQYVALLPRNATSSPLKNGDVIPVSRSSVPPDINSLLDATNRGLEAVPQENLETAINESYTAIGGLGPELARLVKGSTQLAIDARRNLGPLVALIDGSKPVLDTQSDTSDAVAAWAAHLAAITGQLQRHDADVGGLLRNAGPAADQARQLFDRIQPTLPILLANLVSVGQVAVTYQPAIEQLLVLVPQVVAIFSGLAVPNLNTKQPVKGLYLDFHLNLNLPPVCSTGSLPPQQQRAMSVTDFPDRPAGDIYCRVPQDSPFNVRGARNYPCQTVPGKRAPTVKMCESDQQYVPLNDGYNWKGDPNATLSGQDVPQLPPGTPPAPAAPPPAPPPIAAAQYDPATGSYLAPDGHVYTQQDLAATAPKDHSWQNMILPPGS